MGNIFKQLSKVEIQDKPTLQASRLIVEKCENIHLHYRNMRLEFSDKEFLFFADKIEEARKSLENNPEETEYLPLSATLELNTQPEYWRDRISIEGNVGSVHVHYKNFRLELTKDEFRTLQLAFRLAEREFSTITYEVKDLPLESILVNDGGHTIDESLPDGFDCEEKESHLKKIEEIEEAIKKGRKIRPIVVLDNGQEPYQRMDGFCRFMAHKRLGLETIETIICPLAYAGCQNKKPTIITEEVYRYMLYSNSY